MWFVIVMHGLSPAVPPVPFRLLRPATGQANNQSAPPGRAPASVVLNPRAVDVAVGRGAGNVVGATMSRSVGRLLRLFGVVGDEDGCMGVDVLGHPRVRTDGDVVADLDRPEDVASRADDDVVA